MCDIYVPNWLHVIKYSLNGSDGSGGISSKFPMHKDVVIPDNKVHGVNSGPTWVLSAQVGPILAPWTLLSGMLSTECLTIRILFWNMITSCVKTIASLMKC